MKNPPAPQKFWCVDLFLKVDPNRPDAPLGYKGPLPVGLSPVFASFRDAAAFANDAAAIHEVWLAADAKAFETEPPPPAPGRKQTAFIGSRGEILLR